MKYVKPSQIMLIKKGQLDDEWGEGSTAASTVRQGGSSRQATPRTDPPTILFLAMWCPCLPPPSQRLLHIVVFEARSRVYISEPKKNTCINYVFIWRERRGPYGAIRGEIPIQLYALEEVVCNDLGFLSLFLNKQTNKQLYTVK